MVIGILAHVDAGKTTLSEALLYKTGKIRSLGRVDHQDSYLDTDVMERERGITIFSKQARFMLGSKEITLLDTPGHVDFSAEMERTLQVLDYALLVINGTDGVQGHTRTLWRLLAHYRVPTILFINKMDMEGAQKERLNQELRNELSAGCIDFSECFKDDGIHTDAINEELAVCSEQLLNVYLEEGKIPLSLLVEAVAERAVFPCFYGSALRLDGVDELICGMERLTAEKIYGGNFAARVFKIERDGKNARITHLKITGGCLKSREKILYRNDREELIEEKIDQIRRYSGTKYEVAELAQAGELVAVTGLGQTRAGQGLGEEKTSNEMVLKPVLNYNLILQNDVNPMEFLKNLRLLEEEDPKLSVYVKEESKEIHVQLMGRVQMEILARQIKDRFGVAVSFGEGRIVYKETVAKPVEGVGHFEPLRHYAEVHLLLSPAEKGSGIFVESACSEDVLDKNWQRLIATHVCEREHKGVLTGSGLTDVKVTILSGRAHPKHTEGGDFRKATYRAIRHALKRGESVLLEPYYRFCLHIPTEYVGRAMTDLEQRFAKIDAPQFYESGSRQMAKLCGTVPVATVQEYSNEVHAYTKGLGSLLLDLDGYDICHDPLEVIRERGYDSEQDVKNPTSSVFCAHGAGFVVPWDEVEQYMHLPYVYHEDGEQKATDGYFYDSAGCTFTAETAGGRRGTDSWEKTVAALSETELDAKLADVYQREFGLSAEDMEKLRRRKRGSGEKEENRDKKALPHVKYDKKGNAIYPKQKAKEDCLIVDGYNVIFAWEELRELSQKNADAARDALKDTLCNYQGYCGGRVILVFDAYKTKGNPGKREFYDGTRRTGKEAQGKNSGVEVVYTKSDETADAFIERTVHELKDNCRITVATSDALEQQTVLSLGALRMSARELKEQIERTNRSGYEEYLLNKQEKQ